jgi:DNA-binding transcriptional LysR family regulator
MTQAMPVRDWIRRLKMRHLEGFLILNSSRTLSEAATRMHMTQSAVSHWLTDLEGIVGTRLLLRGRQLQPTAAGEALRRLAMRVLGDLDRTQDEFNSIQQGASARLHIGSVTAGVAHLVPAAICTFQARNPDVSIRMSEGKLDDLLNGLEKRELDLIVGSIDARTYRPDLAHEILFDDDVAVIIGHGHPLAQRPDATWPDLLEYPWIMPPPGTLMRMQLDAKLLEQGGAGVRPAVETASIMTALIVLRSTEYVSVCSGTMATRLRDLGVIGRLPLNFSFGPVGMVWRKEDSHPALVAFIRAMRDEVARG